MASITVNLSPATLAALHRSNDDLVRDVTLGAAIYWYARGELSQERAAEAAGLDRTDFILACGKAGVNVFQTDAADFPTKSNGNG